MSRYQRMKYEVVWSTCSLAVHWEKSPPLLILKFSRGDIWNFRDQIGKKLKEEGIKRITGNVVEAIVKTVPAGKIAFKIKAHSKIDPFIIEDDDLSLWAKRVKEEMGE